MSTDRTGLTTHRPTRYWRIQSTLHKKYGYRLNCLWFKVWCVDRAIIIVVHFDDLINDSYSYLNILIEQSPLGGQKVSKKLTRVRTRDHM